MTPTRVWLGLGIGGLTLICGALLFYQPRWLLGILARRAPDVLYYVETDAPVVALTLDDGPHPTTTPRLLDLLARHEAHATFFVIGSRIQGQEELAAEMRERGHELGNHMARDRPSVRLSPREFETSLLEADSVLSQFGTTRWFRPASGWYDREMLRTVAVHGYRCVLGSIYPYDAALPWPRFAAFQVLQNVRPGSIIVLHEGGDRGRNTIAALERILPGLRERGYRVVTLSELVTRR